MSFRNIVLIVVLALIFVLVLTVILDLPASIVTSPPPQPSTPAFALHELGRAGDTGYVLFSLNGSAHVTLLALNQSPTQSIFILKDLDAIGNEHFDEFVDEFTSLTKYGYTVRSGSFLRDVEEDIYIVPTGAMPFYMLEELSHPNRTIIYLGEKDLIIQNGIKYHDWYNELNEEEKSRLVIYNTTLDELQESNPSFIFQQILEQNWALAEKKEWDLQTDNNYTFTIPFENAQYLRLMVIHQDYSMYDSPKLFSRIPIDASPDSLFPWEKSTVTISLNRTNGTAQFQALKDGQIVYEESLGRVHEPNLFFHQLQFSSPGYYILRVTDQKGEIANGLLHVKALDIYLAEVRGNKYVFNISLDGVPLKNGEATVRLNHSENEGLYYIRDGELTVPARLRKGINIFVIRLLGTEYLLPVENTREGILDIYITYGLPGLILVLVVYGVARMTRKPVYRIRFGDVGRIIRKDVHLSIPDALALFSSVRRELGIQGPITAQEFSLGLKHYVTEEAEITDGNVETILKKLIQQRKVETHLGYYQLHGEGDVRRNVLHRMVREILIEEGISFKQEGEHYMLRDMEIGFFGETFKKRGLIVIENVKDKEQLYRTLSPKAHSELRLQELNGRIQFVTPKMLKQIL